MSKARINLDDAIIRGATIDGCAISSMVVLLANGVEVSIDLRNLTIDEMRLLREKTKAKNKYRRVKGSGNIYFMRALRLVKIGYAVEPNRRLKELQTGSSIALKIIHTMPGTRLDEKKLHKRFRKYRVRAGSEWFRLSNEILEFIEDCKHEQAVREWSNSEATKKELGAKPSRVNPAIGNV